MSQKSKCVFNPDWLGMAEYKNWLAAVPNDRHSARCSLCMKTFSVGGMGKSALTSHMEGERHKKRSEAVKEAPTVRNYFQRVPAQSTSGATTLSLAQPVQSSMHSFTSDQDVLKAEILWVLKTVTSHYSYKSSEGTPGLFRHMFPDSKIAEKFTMSERKCAYVACHGLYPYFKTHFRVNMSNEPYVLLFDESLNKKLKEKQMDIHVRLWDHDTVITRYYGSSFLGHATADILLNSFKDDFDLNYSNVLQLSMDGPTVNWAFYNLLQQDIAQEINRDCSMLNLGSCGLHIVHNSFKNGVQASKWGIGSVLTSLYHLFEEAPARREDYKEASGTDVFPLKFCKHRWLENVPVAERAIQIWSGICKYIKKVVQLPKSKQPSCKSFGVVREATEDPLFLSKLHSFISIARQLQPFLTLYQTDRVMIPFLADDLKLLIKGLMKRFVKSEVLKQADSLAALIKVDFEKAENQVKHTNIDIGFSADKRLKELYALKKASDRQLMDFRMAIRDFLAAIVSKLLEKSPVKYSVVRNLRCLDPRKIVQEPDETKKMFKRVLSSLNNVGQVAEQECDDASHQFDDFIDGVIPGIRSTCVKFNPTTDKVDTFFYSALASSENHKVLWKIVSRLLILSHGQASVERGFSVNKQIEVENLSGDSYIALRFICDSVKSMGGNFMDVPITKDMVKSVQGAYGRYKALLEQRQKDSAEGEAKKKRKREEDVLDEFRKKKKLIEGDIKSLSASSDEMAEKATHCSRNDEMRVLLNKSVSGKQ